jgi:glycosyltransferase involved in cell wall biosynthesis
MIVVDDGSTDDTWAILMHYQQDIADKRIRFVQQTNSGSHATINRAISMVRTPYLAILNSDDLFHPDRLNSLLKVAKQQLGDCFIVTGLELIDEAGRLCSEDHWWRAMYAELVSRWSASKAISHQQALISNLLWGNFTVSTSNFFMSRQVWERVGPFRHLKYVPDWDFALRVAFDSSTRFVFAYDLLLLRYRMHGKNTILGGSLRNHAEAAHVLRSFQKQWASQGNAIPEAAIDRLYYLNRFIRHEHTRQMLESQKKGWVEQVDALTTDRARFVEQTHHWQSQSEQWRGQAEQWKAQSLHWEAQTNLLMGSLSFRVTAPMRKATQVTREVIRRAKDIARFTLAKLARARFLPSSANDAYQSWLQAEKLDLVIAKPRFQSAKNAFPNTPIFSVLIPVHNTPAKYLKDAIESVRQQWFDQWQICICDDASDKPETLALLNQMTKEDPRIRCIRRTEGGHIAAATNDAISIATGDYLVFLDHDDLLAPHALSSLAKQITSTPDADLIYSDEDKIDDHGNRSLPFFKPAWSPVLQWSQNYIGHVMCVRASKLASIGGVLAGTQGSQDHDLVLRLASAGARIVHVPQVLYHWRMHAASTSISASAKPYAHTAGKEAVARHLKTRYGNQFRRVDDSPYTFVYEPRFNVPPTAMASIVIPTRDKSDLLRACIESIFSKTVGAAFEIIVIDNGSQETETQSYFRELEADSRVMVVKADVPFNWSRLNNIGRKHSKGQVLVFLNNDTEVISPDWLQRLMEYALLPDVATVGPMLLYPDGTIQHAGVVVGMGGWADHVFKAQKPVHFPSPFVSSVLPRNVMASTGACLAIATERFDLLGGFDEAFQICGSDVEIAIRGHKRGYSNVYLPTVRLYHLESKTRTPHVPEVDFQQSALKYAPYRTEGDPFFNINLHPGTCTPMPQYPANPMDVVERPSLTGSI